MFRSVLASRRSEGQQGWDRGSFAFLASETRMGLTLAPLQRGVRIEDRRIAIVCESELFPEHH